MGQAWYLTAVRTLSLDKYPEPPLAPDQVRVRTLYSGISAGTELTFYRGTNTRLHQRWDPKLRLFRPEPGEWERSEGRILGYEEVGEVVELGSAVSPEAVRVGDRIRGAWGHRTTTVLKAAQAAAQRLPPDLDPRLGVLANIGAVALNGVLDAAIRVTEYVAVFGLGVVGQLAARLATLSGARVLAVDPIPYRRQVAQELGAARVFDPTAEDVAFEIRRLTDGRGADVCIEVTGRAEALHTAVETCAYSGRVVALGFHQGEASGLRLGEEFHLNRINVVSSQTAGVAPELSYRWDADRKRAVVLDLLGSGQLPGDRLLTHVVPFSSAPEVFAMLDQGASDVLQVVLACDGAA
jgi:2-desacetyl-2-hydroxyethyl bacteriochlorophyllide A dehydrogenase